MVPKRYIPLSLKNRLTTLIGEYVEEALLIVWPPLFEESIENTDLSIGLRLKGGSDIVRITIDESQEIVSIIETNHELDKNKYYEFEQLHERLHQWMNNDLGKLDLEMYATNTNWMFSCINQSRIVDVILLYSSKADELIGLRILFENDFILLTPTSDGSTVESKYFRLIDNNIETFSVFEPILNISLGEGGVL